MILQPPRKLLRFPCDKTRPEGRKGSATDLDKSLFKLIFFFLTGTKPLLTHRAPVTALEVACEQIGRTHHDREVTGEPKCLKAKLCVCVCVLLNVSAKQ